MSEFGAPQWYDKTSSKYTVLKAENYLRVSQEFNRDKLIQNRTWSSHTFIVKHDLLMDDILTYHSGKHG